MRPGQSRTLRVAAFGALAAAAMVVQPTAMQQAAGPSRQVVTIDGQPAIAGEVLVRYRDSPTPQEWDQLRQLTDADEDTAIGGSGVRRIHSRSFTTSTLLAILRAHPEIAYAEPNYIIQSDAVPNDPWFGQLWGLLNTGQAIGTAGTAGADIDATLAWDVSTGSRDNVVAVVDTGVNYTHSDLAANVWSAPAPFTVTVGSQTITCAAGTHGFNAIARTCDPYDDHGHGTHVSGTIGAVGDNNSGVVGVNWTASIMASKFLDANGLGTVADAIDAIEFVIQAAAATGTNVRVLSNSWSSSGSSQALLDEITRAHEHDMLFVASAGNNGWDNDVTPRYPASYNTLNMIAVASTGNRDVLAGNSNYGATSVHLAAPGVNILSTVPDEAYQYLSGTSMAVPHVSGAAVLVLSRCALNTAALKNNLLASVDPIPLLAGRVLTGGRLNANTAIRACGPDFSVSASPATQTVAPGASTSYTVTVTPSGGFAGSVTFSASGLPSDATVGFSPPSLTSSGSSTMTVWSSAATPAGSFPLTITGTSDNLVHTGSTAGTILVLANDSDPDGDSLTVTGVDAPQRGNATANGDGTITYLAAANYNGADMFTYTISDSRGGTATNTVSMTITAVNDSPVASNQTVVTDEDTARTITLSATDPEGSALTYAIVAGPARGTLSGTPPAVTYTPAANDNGPDSFTFSANDGSLDSNVATVSITVTAVDDPPPPGGLGVDTTVCADGAGPISTPSFSTAEPGELLVAFVGSDGPTWAEQSVTVSGADLPWTLVRRANTSLGTSEIWQALAGTTISNAVVFSTQTFDGYHQSMTVVAFKGAAGVGATAVSGDLTGAPSVSLVATEDGSFVYGVGNDWDNAIARVLGPAQTMVHEWVDTQVGDTFWVQALAAAATAGTTVTLNDTSPTTDQWNFAAAEILAAGIEPQ
jgi:subtilisin family serine protease